MKKTRTFNRVWKLGILLGIAWVLVSCGNAKAQENTLTFKENGTIEAVYVSSFPSEKYDFSALETEVRESADAFNDVSGKRLVTVKEVTLEEETARVAMNYKSDEAYAAFNEVTCFNGTLEEARSSMVLPDTVQLHSPDGTKETSFPVIFSMEGENAKRYRIIAVAEKTVVVVSGSPVYISENVTVSDDGTIRANANAQGSFYETAYIVYEASK